MEVLILGVVIIPIPNATTKKKLLKGKIIILNIHGNIDKFNVIAFNM